MLGDAVPASPAGPLATGGLSQSRGVAGLTAFAERLPGWSLREDFPTLARYGSACIEAFGTGGGNFRNLYAGFLDSAHRRLPDLVGSQEVEAMRKSAASWTELSRQLAAAGTAAASERPTLIAAAQATVRGTAQLESSIFEKLSLATA